MKLPRFKIRDFEFADIVLKLLALPIPSSSIEKVLDAGDDVLARFTGVEVEYTSEMGGASPEVKARNLALAVEQDARAIARVRVIQVAALLEEIGVDIAGVQQGEKFDPSDLGSIEFIPREEKGSVHLVDLLDDVGTFFNQVDAIDRADSRWAATPEIAAIASVIDMLRGSWRRACEATGRKP